ncbi:glycosyltransferase family 4 protein [Acinetobacter sp. YH01008]|uniref:glycosyltransferase family 4 protein n=1 Tax=Acinetobacter sp. YH01008 TaxID=2601024 RepID=UPI0015D1BB50|nr:glycosyltransferase family 4 protein [Acinetobacter sp. YH01008]
MRIVLLSRVIFLSGVTTHLISLAKGLIERGHQVYIMTAGPEDQKSEANVKLFQDLIDIGVTPIILPFPKKNNNKYTYLLSLLYSLIDSKRVLDRYEFDIIHVHTPILSFIPKILKRKFIRTIHTADLNLSVLNCKADYEIVISKELYVEAINKYNYTEESIDLINNGVPRDFYQPEKKIDKIINLKKIYNIQEEIVIGLVGSINYNKGHDILIKAISLLPSHIKSNVHILFLGDGEKDLVINLLKEKKLSEQCTFLSFQDPLKIYPSIDIKVLPSRLEGFPLATIEAMLMGCCVIRSNTEGATEQITHGKTGFIFENENYSELSNILLELIKNKELRNQVSQAGQTYALEHFISDIMVNKTLTVYQKALREN